MSNEPKTNYERKLNNYNKRKKNKEDSKKTMSQQEKRFVYSFLGCFGLIAIVLLFIGIGIVSTSAKPQNNTKISSSVTKEPKKYTKLTPEENQNLAKYLNSELSINENNVVLTNSNTMNFQAGGAVAVFFFIPDDYRSYSEDIRQKFVNNVLELYQLSFDNWNKANGEKIQFPPYLYVKYKDNTNMAVWVAGMTEMELK